MTRKLMITLGLVAAMALAATPALAQGPGYGRGGYGMQAGYGMGPGMMGGGFGPGWGAANVDPEQAKAFRAEVKKFYDDNQTLRQEVRSKRLELRALMINPKSTKESLLAKQKEMFQLRDQLATKRLIFRKDLQTKYPELAKFGWGRGFNRGHGRGDFGPGYGRGGYGPRHGRGDFGPGYGRGGYGPRHGRGDFGPGYGRGGYGYCWQ